jgi:DNA-binding MarR family transcriptional regulator
MPESFLPPNIAEQNKDNSRRTQVKTIFEYLKTHTATASMIAKATGIPKSNITRFKRDLEKAGALWEIERKPCKVTGFKAWYLTTDFENKVNNNPLRHQIMMRTDFICIEDIKYL